MPISPMTDVEYNRLETEYKNCTNKKRWRGQILYGDGTLRRVIYEDGLFVTSIGGRKTYLLPISVVRELDEEVEVTYEKGSLEKTLEGQDIHEFVRLIRENRTGNHKRNRTLRIPRRASEPVRG